MKIIQVREQLSRGKNLMFYKRDVFNCYNQLKSDFSCVYSNKPVPVKFNLTQAVNLVSDEKHKVLYKKTIPELMDILIDDLGSRTLIFIFNNFEKLTSTSVENYQFLNNQDNILFICSISGHFRGEKKAELYNFYKLFKFANKEDLEEDTRKDEINITYTVYLLLAALSFIIYLKTASSIFMAGVLIGAAWFAFLIFRTILFVGGKV